jgi:hypothetical protein
MLQTLLDVWEGSLDVSEDIILAGGVVGLIIRLNHMTGGHHLDINFITQWEQARNFLRAPYFVYNPWVDGHANFLWLINNIPKQGVSIIFADVEVAYSGYSAEVYADEVQKFYGEISTQFKTIIYTGQWFLSFLSHWILGEYWWARYPNRFHPVAKENWSYEKLEQETENYGYFPDPQGKCPGVVSLWQCSGDRIILPGCADRPVDVSLFNGTFDDLKKWWGVPATTAPTMIQKVDILWREAQKHPDWNLVA